MSTKLFYNAAVFTPRDPGHPLSGSNQGRIQTYSPGALLCRNGRIECIGPEKEVLVV